MIKTLAEVRFRGIIWKMLIDEPGGILAVETRGKDDPGAFFTTINLADGAVLLADHQISKEWPCGLEAIRNGVLLLHGYESEGSPAHLGLMALDAAEGTLLWQNFLWAADAFYDEFLTVFNRKILPWKKQPADWRSGNILNAEKKGTENSTLKIPVKTAQWPEHLPAPEAAPVGYIDYLRLDEAEILSLHAQNEEGFDQHIRVYKNSRLMHQDLLMTGIQKLQPEAFVMQQNRLLYIRNQNELVIIDIAAGK
ncbi:MAG: DUF4905 domain-containing protein [Mucilaginibacter polytrichastri]|nr:DUF4905 domain-containing protein [Mucilaginibacter polytrichastri]